MTFVFRCQLCTAPLKIETSSLEFIDKDGGYPCNPETLATRLACSDCETSAYRVPLRDLLAVDEFEGWLRQLLTKKWMNATFYYDLAEAHGIAERIQALSAPLPARKIPPALARITSGAASNPRSISLGLRARIMERDGFRCRRCGCGPDDSPLVIDHVIPVSKGGTANEDNLQTLCHPCNAGKSDREPHPHDHREP